MMSGRFSPKSSTSSSSSSLTPDKDNEREVWTTEGQGPLMHWLLFDLSSKYDPESLHRKLDGLVFRILSLPSATVSPNDRDAVILLRKEPQDRQYLLCVGREEPWQSVWPEDRIMTAIQNAGLATARHLGTTAARRGVISSGLPVNELLSEGWLWKKAQVEGKV